MRILSIIIICSFLLLNGCAGKPQPCEPIIKTEYVEVKVPVIYKLKRPSRPKIDESEPIPLALIKFTSYTETLESIIDGTNKK